MLRSTSVRKSLPRPETHSLYQRIVASVSARAAARTRIVRALTDVLRNGLGLFETEERLVGHARSVGRGKLESFRNTACRIRHDSPA
jgi:hypothetical protein